MTSTAMVMPKKGHPILFKVLIPNTKEQLCTAMNSILFWVVRMLFTWDLKDCRRFATEIVHDVPDLRCNVLIDEENCNIWTSGEASECVLNLARRGLPINDHEV
mmetsp:Transcript_30547/g.76268  ORF Transcript_30547/g.76268 Transcript_30547/m.76268 type:complete len:104 (-) Transcript_30547:148-459(-)